MARIHELNERALAVLRELTRAGSDNNLPRCIKANEILWSELTDKAIKVVAAFPFTLLDLRFTDAASWQTFLCVELSTHGTLPREVGAMLAQETMMFAWQAARFNRSAARFLFGMSVDVADVVAGFSPREVCDAAADGWRVLSIRWEDDVELWSELLTAAEQGGKDELKSIREHVRLRFLGDLCGGA